MKIACICSTKNEGDIIEAFVRLNGRVCDTFFFADESTDNTREILGLLSKEGYDIHFLPRPQSGHNQPNSTKILISAVVRSMHPDWIFLLDADEIIVVNDRLALFKEMAKTSSNVYLTAPWITFVPTTLNFFESNDPLFECFAPRKERGESFRKASVPGSLASDAIPTAGNHTVISAVGAPIQERRAQSYYLAHFPVRSSDQIVVKNLIAMHNLMSRTDALKGEGFHVFSIADQIRSRNYQLTLEDIQIMALNYSCPEPLSPVSISSELEPQYESQLSAQLKYRELGRIQAMARLDLEIERLSKELRGLKRGFKIQSLNFQPSARGSMAATQR
jgi:hypothetical protein